MLAYDKASVAELDRIDADVDAKIQQLQDATTKWLDQRNDIQWLSIGNFNNEMGYFQIFSSTNHRASSIWDLMEFVAKSSSGSFGLVYVHDDEDLSGNKNYGRGDRDYSQSFRAWRILDGQVTEHDDPFFSPFSSAHAFELHA